MTETSNANGKRALRERKAALVAKQEAETEVALKTESVGRMEEFKLDARRRHEKQDKPDEDKK